ncbi:ClbS/DfsB family four-helix bundle protein [Cutibacterium modestum]
MGSFGNEELFTKEHYRWTGMTSLGSYFRVIDQFAP